MVKKLYPIVFFATATILAFWKVIFHPEFTLLTGGDMCSQSYPWFNVASYWLKKGSLLLWDPYVFSGKPTLGEVQPGILYPLNWAFMLVPSQDGGMNMLAMEGLLILNYFLAAYFCFLLARSFNITPTGAAAGGITFALSGFTTQVYGYMNIFSGFIWLPLILLCFHRAIKSDERILRLRWIFFSGLCISFSFLAGHHVPPVQAGFYLFLFSLFVTIRDWKLANNKKRMRPPISLALVAFFALLITAPQWLPALEWARNAYRWVGQGPPIEWGQKIPYSILQETGGSHPQDVLSLLFPYMSTGVSIYIGPTVLFLAVIGLLFGRNPKVVFLGIAAFVYLFLSWGTFSIVHGLANTFVPGLWFAREVFHYLIPFQLSVALLAGLGLDHIATVGLSQIGFHSFMRRAGWFMGLLVFFCGSMIVVLRIQKEAPFDDFYITSLSSLAVYTFLLGSLLFLFLSRRVKPIMFCYLILMLIFLDLASHVSKDVRTKHQPRNESNPSVHAYWKKPQVVEHLQSLRRTKYFRVDDPSGVLPPNFGDAWLLYETMGHGATMQKRYLTFRGTGWNSISNASSLLNVNYVTDENSIPGAKKIYQNGSLIYSNPRVVPRAFLASRYRTFENEDQMLQWISSPMFAPQETALFLNTDIQKLPTSFLNLLRNENDDIPVTIGSLKRGEEKFIWGWNPNDQITLTVSPRSVVDHAFLFLNYYPTNTSLCELRIRIKKLHQTREMNVELDGLKENEAKWAQLKRQVINLGGLQIEDNEIIISKTDKCTANIDSLRVSKIRDNGNNPGTVSIVSYSPNRLTLTTNSKNASLLVLSELYYPGWKAKVNSQKALLLQGNFILRVLSLQEGSHKIDLYFRPKTFIWGAIVSVISLAICLVIVTKK